MSKIIKPDICILGGGAGGLAAASAAVALGAGAEIVLVAKDATGDGRLRHGCVPARALAAAGARAQTMRDSAAFGVEAVEPAIDFRKVRDYVDGVAAAIAPDVSKERLIAMGVRVIEAEAVFTDNKTLMAGDHEIRAHRFVLATGSSPAIPDIPGLDHVDYLTSETVFDLTRRPGRLVILGGGPNGLELAQAHRRLGCQVTILEAQTALGREDRELADIVKRRLRAEGIALHENCVVHSVERRGKTAIRVNIECDGTPRTIDGTHLLIAAGRKPNLEGLGLDAAGIVVTDSGIEVDDRLRTGNRRIYAIGDVAGGDHSAHLAEYHAGLAARSILFGQHGKRNDGIVPRVTFTDPELAHIGLTEAEARASHKALSILRWPLSENDRARIERRTQGFIKLVADRKGTILGVSIVGSNASELIAMWALAMERKLRLRDLTGHVPPYPTMSEIGKRAVLSYFSQMARKPAMRSFVRFLRIFG